MTVVSIGLRIGSVGVSSSIRHSSHLQYTLRFVLPADSTERTARHSATNFIILEAIFEGVKRLTMHKKYW